MSCSFLNMKIVDYQKSGNCLMLYFECIEPLLCESIGRLRTDPRFVDVAKRHRLTSSALEFGTQDPHAKLFKASSSGYGHYGDQVFEIGKKGSTAGIDRDYILVNTDHPGIAREVFGIITGQDLRGIWSDYLGKRQKPQQQQQQL